jgi:hypothetical protein
MQQSDQFPPVNPPVPPGYPQHSGYAQQPGAGYPQQQGYMPQPGQGYPQQPGYVPQQYQMMPGAVARRKRPVAITIICAFMILGVIFGGLGFLGLLAQADLYPGWFFPYYGLSLALGVVALVGLALMKKWSIIVYTANFALNMVLILVVGATPSIVNIAVPLVVIVIGFVYFKQMD